MVAFSDQNSVRSHTMMDFEKIGSLWCVLLVELISPISGHTPEVAHSPAVTVPAVIKLSLAGPGQDQIWA